MDRVYAGQKGGYTNPDYQLDDLPQNGYQYQDDPKQPYTYEHSVPTQMFQGELDEEEDTPYASKGSVKRIGLHLARLVFTVLFIGLLLGIPMLITMNQAYDLTNDDTIQNKNFVFWFFCWLECTFAIAVGATIVALVFPYLFYFIAKYVNPAHRRYWRIFRALKGPWVCVITVAFAWLWFVVFVEWNPYCSYNYWATIQLYATPSDSSNSTVAADAVKASNGTITVTTSSSGSSDPPPTAQQLGSDRTFFIDATYVIDQFLMNAIFWAMAYLFEKIVIVYISIHYHYRSDHSRIERCKQMITSLSKLYKTSVARYPLYGDRFQDQDIIIRDAIAAGHRNKRDAIKFFQKIGGASHKVLGAFGSMLGSGKGSHWLKPGSTYAIVEHALDHPSSARALAQRIWLSLVPYGEVALTKEHIAGALDLDEKEQASKIFAVLDENENGDIRMTELEPMLIEAGKTRLNIYQNMQEIDHAINTFDWILLIWIAIFMLFMILLGYVDFLKQLKDIFGFVGLGIGVAVKSIATDFFLGAVFIFFKHPYDIGDRIDLYNLGEGGSVGVVVKRISLLYCVFERTDTGATVQFPNARLWMKRIENLSRSGRGQEKLTLFLNIDTSFKDLEYLRDEMKTWLADSENSRDYKSNVALRVKSIHELEKMQVALVVTHKSNWSNDALKSARSSRLYCRLIEIARKVPLYKPGGGRPALGDEGKPNYMVVVSEEEANIKRAEDRTKALKKRHDFEIVDNSNLDAEAKKEKEEALRAAEAEAYKDLSSVPATMAGRIPDRPDAKPAKQPKVASSTAVQYTEEPRQRSRPLMGTSTTSSERPLYDNSYSYQGQQYDLNAPPPQTYDGRRGQGNGLHDGTRGGYRV